jgi:hypothetical protein
MQRTFPGPGAAREVIDGENQREPIAGWPVR